ncbi:hypothetical protein D3C80_1925820 [compost metagenome]
MDKQGNHDKQCLGIHIGEAGLVLHVDMRNVFFNEIQHQHTGNQPKRQGDDPRFINRLRH